MHSNQSIVSETDGIPLWFHQCITLVSLFFSCTPPPPLPSLWAISYHHIWWHLNSCALALEINMSGIWSVGGYVCIYQGGRQTAHLSKPVSTCYGYQKLKSDSTLLLLLLFHHQVFTSAWDNIPENEDCTKNWKHKRFVKSNIKFTIHTKLQLRLCILKRKIRGFGSSQTSVLKRRRSENWSGNHHCMSSWSTLHT